MRLFIIICILYTCCTLSTAQKILKQLTTDQGLSENKCFDVFQDSDGYMWIGTSIGANKYDGKDVLHFDRSMGLLSDHIYSFHEDSQHRIWINNINGEPLFIKNNEVHNRFTDPYLEDINGNNYFRSVNEDKHNRIIFSYIEGYLTVLDNDSTMRIEISAYLDSTLFDVFGAYPYKDEIIIITSYSILALDINTFELKWKVPIFPGRSYLRNQIFNEKLYLFSTFDAFVFDLVTKEFNAIERLDGGPPIYDCRVLYDELLISTSDGISVLRDSAIVDYPVLHSLDNMAISALHIDQHCDLWIATKSNGVFSFYNSDVEQSKYHEFDNVNYIHTFSEDSVFIVQDDWTVSLLIDNKLLWSQKLNKIDENKFNNIFHKNGELWIVDKYQIHKDVGGQYETFSIYSRKANFIEESNMYYWVGNRGLSVIEDFDIFNDYVDFVDVWNTHPVEYMHFDINNPYDMEIDSNYNVWVGSEEGLLFIRNGEMCKITNEEVDGSITDISLNGNKLIGVNYGTGIFCYNSSSGKADILTREDGLPTNYFTQLETNGNDIWVSHANGICLLRLEENGLKNIKNYGKEHGIPIGRINEISIIDDICHFVVNGKIYKIKPDQIINDKVELLMDTTELTYFTNESHTVIFDCINFTFGNKIQYEYRLMPRDTVWEKTNGEKIDLAYIPAGNYELEVRAIHPLNLINPIRRKPIRILKKWYDKASFRCFVLLFITFVLFFLVRIKALSFNSKNFKYWIATKIQKYFVKEELNSFNLKDIKGVVHLLKIDEIKFIKSSGNYLEYHTNERKYISRMTMSNAVEKFKIWSDFERVHRSYMVNFSKIEAIDHNFLKVGNIDIPFTDRYKEIIERKLKL